MSVDVKKFILKLLLFTSPFVVLLILEFFILPIDYFTFRIWESVRVKKFYAYLPGPFYPNQQLTKVEVGDLAPHTRLALPHQVSWSTDRYGFRNQDSSHNDYDIVIIGDSTIAGTGVSQEETLAVALAHLTTKKVYAYAPSDLNTFLMDRRFKNHPPPVVVVAAIERNIETLPLLKDPKKGWKQNVIHWMQNNAFLQKTLIIFDRLIMDNMLNALKSKIAQSFDPKEPIAVDRQVFLQGSKANQRVSPAQIAKIVSNLEVYQKRLALQGSCFIFLPIPNKENIYYRMLKDAAKPEFLNDLVKELENHQIHVVHTQQAFERAYEQHHQELYIPDDTHWNGAAIKLTAEELVQTIKVCSP